MSGSFLSAPRGPEFKLEQTVDASSSVSAFRFVSSNLYSTSEVHAPALELLRFPDVQFITVRTSPQIVWNIQKGGIVGGTALFATGSESKEHVKRPEPPRLGGHNSERRCSTKCQRRIRNDGGEARRHVRSLLQ